LPDDSFSQHFFVLPASKRLISIYQVQPIRLWSVKTNLIAEFFRVMPITFYDGQNCIGPNWTNFHNRFDIIV